MLATKQHSHASKARQTELQDSLHLPGSIDRVTDACHAVACSDQAAALVFPKAVFRCQIGPHDLLIMMRPTGLPANAYQPLTVQLAGDVGGHWDPKQYRRRRDPPTGAQHVLLGL